MIKIQSTKYWHCVREWREKSTMFKSSIYFDAECGIRIMEYVGTDDGMMEFNVVDERRFRVARLKWHL